MALRYLIGGESHGRMLLGILEGIPAGLPITADEINRDLTRRQGGYGRGGRMRIEKDRVELVSGVRHGVTLGGPIGLLIENRDWQNWQGVMGVEPTDAPPERVVTKPRPGHADLAGALKYGHRDIRNVLEKASARETAMRVAIGGVAKQLLGQFGVRVISHVVEIGGVQATLTLDPERQNETYESWYREAEQSEVRCADPAGADRMIARIKEAKRKGDSLGGVFEVAVLNPPVGLGSYSQWDRRLNARLAMALMSIQAIKGVEVGLGFEAARRFGSEVHDEIFYARGGGREESGRGTGFYRRTNNAGGIEGGVSNGQPIVVRAAMKPIATLYSPLRSVDLISKEPFEASVERSDVCAVPAAAVVGEAVVAFEVAREMVRKFGGDSLAEMRRNYDAYLQTLEAF